MSVILIAAAFPFRFPIGGGRTASLFDAAVLIVFVLFMFILLTRKAARVPRSFVWLATVSIAASLASIGWSSAASATTLYLVSSVEAFLVFVMFVTLLRDAPPKQIINLVSMWIFLLLLGSVLLWMRVPGFLPPSNIDPFSGDYISYFSRLSHPFIGRSNNLAALLSLFVIPLAVFAWRKKNQFAGAVAAIGISAIILTLSRGTLLALIASIVVYLIIDGKSGRQYARQLVPALLFTGLLGWIVVAVNPATVTHIASRFSTAGLDARSDLFSDARQVIGDSWLLGVGAGTGSDVHNTFLQQAVYFGLFIGTAICISLIAVVVAWFCVHDSTRWLSVAIGIGFVAQFASFLVESSYEGTLLRPLMWMSWGLMVALLNAERVEQVTISAAPLAAKTRTSSLLQGAKR